MCTAFQGIPAGTDDEDYEYLSAQRLNEPAGLKQLLAGLQNHQHDVEGQEVEQGADRTDHEHEVADEIHVEYTRVVNIAGVHLVHRDRDFRDVVENVVEQNLRR